VCWQGCSPAASGGRAGCHRQTALASPHRLLYRLPPDSKCANQSPVLVKVHRTFPFVWGSCPIHMVHSHVDTGRAGRAGGGDGDICFSGTRSFPRSHRFVSNEIYRGGESWPVCPASRRFTRRHVPALNRFAHASGGHYIKQISCGRSYRRGGSQGSSCTPANPLRTHSAHPLATRRPALCRLPVMLKSL
jgi:hypothetical protein